MIYIVYRRFLQVCCAILLCTLAVEWLEKTSSSHAATLHKWEKVSTDVNMIHTGSHEFTYWKNFMRHTRTCDISQKVKTIVYYCDLHNHTKSESIHIETVHSERHS